MKVALANKHFLGLAGGAERNISDIANYLAAHGFEVFILSETKHGSAPAFPLRGSVRVVVPDGPGEDAMDPALLRHMNDPEAMEWAKSTASMRKRWGAAMRKIAPDAIITFMPHTSTMLLQELGEDYPIIVTNQNDPAIDYFSDKHGADDTDRRLRLEGLQLAAAVHFLTPPFVQAMPEFVQRKAVVIPNASPPPRAFSHMGGANRIVGVGRLEPQKGFDLLIEAFSLVERRRPDWQLHLFGAGVMEASLREQIRRYRLQRSVFLRGFTSDPVSELANSDIFVIPSFYEGWGLTLTEAMSVGLPAIGMRDCSGVNWLIENNRNGLLVERSAPALADAIVKLIDDPAERTRLGQAGRQHVTQFAPEIVYAKWASVLKEVVAAWQARKASQSASQPTTRGRRWNAHSTAP